MKSTISHPDSYLNLLCSTGNALHCGAAVEILQASSRVSLLHHMLSSAMTHTQTHMKPDRRAHAHIKHTKKNDKDTQVTHSFLLTPWLEACRRTGLTTHTHPALPTSVKLLFLYRALGGRGKKTEEKKKHLVDFGSRVSPHLHRMY